MVIVLADVIANNGADVPSAVFCLLRTLIADQQKTTFVIVAVVVLNDGVTAVPVGIEAHSVVQPFHSINFIELDDGVVGTPRPDAVIVGFRPLIGFGDN